MEIDRLELREFITRATHHGEGICNIDDDAPFEKIGMDSIEFISLIVALEDEYNIEFDDDDLLFARVNTINKLVEILKKY